VTNDNWKRSLERFFFDRASLINDIPTLRDHCLVSAKDPRLAAQPGFHADLVGSLITQMSLDSNSSVLEVGCASGYIACGLAPRVAKYVGIDLAESTVRVARKMPLQNAHFEKADGADLPFVNAQFDAAFACDVFSNFPSFDAAKPLIQEMVRVVRPGGRVMVASVTDASRSEEFQRHVYKVSEQLDDEYGPIPVMPQPKVDGWVERIKRSLFGRTTNRVTPQIINYNFNLRDFKEFAELNGLDIDIKDVHQLNPYRGFRFNIIYTKPNE
jgi:ubiquinone/menaquinone biosynthesis C-methylase UbiE